MPQLYEPRVGFLREATRSLARNTAARIVAAAVTGLVLAYHLGWIGGTSSPPTPAPPSIDNVDAIPNLNGGWTLSGLAHGFNTLDDVQVYLGGVVVDNGEYADQTGRVSVQVPIYATQFHSGSYPIEFRDITNRAYVRAQVNLP